jgi:hypothetical protein
MWLVLGAALVASTFAVFGLQTGIIALAFPAATFGVWYAVRSPTVMLWVIIVIDVTNVANVIESATILVRLSIGLGVVCACLALRNHDMRSRLNRGVWWCGVFVTCYLVTQLLAVLGSEHAGASAVLFRNTLLDCVFLLLLLVLTLLSGKPWGVAAAVVVPLAALSLLCLINQVFFGGAMPFGGFAKIAQVRPSKRRGMAGPPPMRTSGAGTWS